MVKRLCRYGIGALALTVLLPAPARAQVYPDRISSTIKAAIATAYQRHDQDDREQQVERTSKVVHLGSSGTLDLGNIAGDITVSRGGGGDATIEIVKTARAETVDAAKSLLGLVQVQVDERSGRAEVRTHYPSGDETRRDHRRNVNVSVAYTVTAPAGTRVTIQSISGSIKITDIKGDVNAGSVSGDVHIAGADHVTAAKSISGTVDVSDVHTDGALQAASVSGDVLLHRISASTIDGGSISGNVRIDDIQCRHVAAHTVSGNVNYAGTIGKNGRYEMKSFSGEVRLAIPASSGFELDANSFSGNVRSDLPITTHGDDASRRGRRRVLSGTYGDGSAVLDVTTFSGNIVITRQ